MGETKTKGMTKIRGPKFTDISPFACQSNAFISKFCNLLVCKLLVFASVRENVLDLMLIKKPL